MTWIKLDNRAIDHPKVASLTDRAFRWWVKGLSYASAFLTNGTLPPIFWKQTPKQIRAELAEGRLWDWVDPNFEIHDYLKHQSSREAVDRKRELSADRVKRYRERVSNAVTSAQGNAVSNAHVTPLEIRDQRSEIRDQKEREEPRARARTTGNGANEPGSLPRDHLHHSVCGPSYRICLKTWECGELMRQYGGDDTKRKAAVETFVAALEASLGADDSIGPFSWIEKHFQAWLLKINRAPISPSVKAGTPNGHPPIVPSSDAVTEAIVVARRREDLMAEGLTRQQASEQIEREADARRAL